LTPRKGCPILAFRVCHRVIMRQLSYVLLLPALLILATADASAQSCQGRVAVAYGDTLSDIARRCGTSVDRIVGANPGLRPQRLRAGSVIAVPRQTLPTQQRQIGRRLVERAPSSYGTGISGTIDINRPRLFNQPPAAGPRLAPVPYGMRPAGASPIDPSLPPSPFRR
jgi:hypothetical protein